MAGAATGEQTRYENAPALAGQADSTASKGPEDRRVAEHRCRATPAALRSQLARDRSADSGMGQGCCAATPLAGVQPTTEPLNPAEELTNEQVASGPQRGFVITLRARWSTRGPSRARRRPGGPKPQITAPPQPPGWEVWRTAPGRGCWLRCQFPRRAGRPGPAGASNAGRSTCVCVGAGLINDAAL